MPTSRIFIASSTEGLKVANEIKWELENRFATESAGCDVQVWNEDVFKEGRYTLEDLVDKFREVDLGVFVLRSDDRLFVRLDQKGQLETKALPRDNVIFELGMCIQALGRERSFILCEAEKEPKVPTDLNGVTYRGYVESEIPDGRDATLRGGPSVAPSIAAACDAICEKIDAIQQQHDARPHQDEMRYTVKLCKRMKEVGFEDADSLRPATTLDGFAASLGQPPVDKNSALSTDDYYFLHTKLSKSCVLGATGDEFAVAVALDSNTLEGLNDRKDIIFRELVDLPPVARDRRWWDKLHETIDRMSRSRTTTLQQQLDAVGIVASFRIQAGGAACPVKRVEAPRGAFLIWHEWPAGFSPGTTPVKISYLGLQPRSQQTFPMNVLYPTRKVRLIFDYTFLDDISAINHTVRWDSDGKVVVHHLHRRELAVSADDGLVRAGNATIRWSPKSGTSTVSAGLPTA